MNEIVKAMERLGVYKDADTLRQWGLNENSSELKLRIVASEYLSHINR